MTAFYDIGAEVGDQLECVKGSSVAKVGKRYTIERIEGHKMFIGPHIYISMMLDVPERWKLVKESKCK